MYVIVVVPTDTPVTTPDVIPTVATAVLLLVHDTPPEVLLVTSAVLPAQTDSVPPIAFGITLTVSVAVR